MSQQSIFEMACKLFGEDIESRGEDFLCLYRPGYNQLQQRVSSLHSEILAMIDGRIKHWEDWWEAVVINKKFLVTAAYMEGFTAAGQHRDDKILVCAEKAIENCTGPTQSPERTSRRQAIAEAFTDLSEHLDDKLLRKIEELFQLYEEMQKLETMYGYIQGFQKGAELSQDNDNSYIPDHTYIEQLYLAAGIPNI